MAPASPPRNPSRPTTPRSNPRMVPESLSSASKSASGSARACRRSRVEQKENGRDLKAGKLVAWSSSSSSKSFMAPTISAASKAVPASPRRKILSEFDENVESNFSPFAAATAKSGASDETSVLLDMASPSLLLSYDPKTNYLSPRPQFLHYKPNSRIEQYMSGKGLSDIFDGSLSSSDGNSENTSEHGVEVCSHSLTKVTLEEDLLLPDIAVPVIEQYMNGKGVDDIFKGSVSSLDGDSDHTSEHGEEESSHSLTKVALEEDLVLPDIAIPDDNSKREETVEELLGEEPDHSKPTPVKSRGIAKFFFRTEVVTLVISMLTTFLWMTSLDMANTFSFFADFRKISAVDRTVNVEFGSFDLNNLTMSAMHLVDAGICLVEEYGDQNFPLENGQEKMQVEPFPLAKLEGYDSNHHGPKVQDTEVESEMSSHFGDELYMSTESGPYVSEHVEMMTDGGGEQKTEVIESDFGDGIFRSNKSGPFINEREYMVSGGGEPKQEEVETISETMNSESNIFSLNEFSSTADGKKRQDLIIDNSISEGDIVVSSSAFTGEEPEESIESSENQSVETWTPVSMSSVFTGEGGPKESLESSENQFIERWTLVRAAAGFLIIGALLAPFFFLQMRKQQLQHWKHQQHREIKKNRGTPENVSVSGSSESYLHHDESAFQNPSRFKYAEACSSSLRNNYQRSPRHESSSSTSYGSFTTYEKIAKKGGSDEEVMTPVRRSSRLRNHVRSP